MGWRMGLGTGEAVVSTQPLNQLGDRLTVLEAALEDVERDLKDSTSDGDYRDAFEHLYAAAVGLRGQRLRVRALPG